MRTCACALLLRDDQVLLGHRSPERDYYPDVWDLIGGHTRTDESPEAAMIREVVEEIGSVPTEFRLLETRQEPNAAAHGPGEFHVFLVSNWSGPEPHIRNAEHDELAWFTPREARRLRLADPGYVDLLDRVEALLSGRTG